MEAIIYLAQVSACLGAFYLFYYLLLSRLTFFTLNRWYLMITLVLSFAIPKLSIPFNKEEAYPQIVKQVVHLNELQQPAPTLTIVNAPLTPAPALTWADAAKMIYTACVLLLSVRLLMIVLAFLTKVRKRQRTRIGGVCIVQSDKGLDNGSFFNYIFLNDDELSSAEMEQIIAHEMLHVKLYHSVDRVLVKLVQIVLWFNPFVYLYARAIEENHEFEVDREVGAGTNKVEYAELLLHLSVARQGTLYHNFSMVPLKKRITMLFTKPTHKMKRVIYLLVVPVVLISCLAFAKLKGDEVKKSKVIAKSKDQDSSKVKFRQIVKHSEAQQKAIVNAKREWEAYLQTPDGARKNKLQKEIYAKDAVLTVLNIAFDKNGKQKGFVTQYEKNGYNYLVRTDYGQSKRLNTLLKKGDIVSVRIFSAGFSKKNEIVSIMPAYVMKDGKKIFELFEAGKIPVEPFLYEANKVRFAEGQITDITKYPNGKWKTAVFERVNGYKFDLTFKPNAPNLNSISDGDHITLRFVHEVKTGAKSYKINDWVAISMDIKDYGIKNPEWFGKFYEVVKAKPADTVRISAISGIKELGEHPLVLIDGRKYSKDILYKMSGQVIKSSSLYRPNNGIKKYGDKAKDGAVIIESKAGLIYDITAIEKVNLQKIAAAKSQFFSRITLTREDGSKYDLALVNCVSGNSAAADLPLDGKIAFIVKNKIYNETDFQRLFPEYKPEYGPLLGVSGVTKKFEDRGYELDGYRLVFEFGSYPALKATEVPFKTGAIKSSKIDDTSENYTINAKPSLFATGLKRTDIYRSWNFATPQLGKPALIRGGSSNGPRVIKTISAPIKKLIEKPLIESNEELDDNNNKIEPAKPTGAIYDPQSDSTVKARFAGKVIKVMDVLGTSLIIVKNGEYFAAYINLSTTNVTTGQDITDGQLLGATAYNPKDGNREEVFQLYHGSKLIENTQDIEAVISGLTSPKVNMLRNATKFYAYTLPNKSLN